MLGLDRYNDAGASDARASARPSGTDIPKSRMCGPQVRFCERGPCLSGGPYSTAMRAA